MKYIIMYYNMDILGVFKFPVHIKNSLKVLESEFLKLSV